MAAYLGPGLGLTDKIIDNHFDKIPTKFFDKNTYKPGRSRRQRRRESQDERSRSDSEDERGSGGSGSGEKQKSSNSSRELARSPPERERDIPEIEEADDMQEPRRIPRHSGDGAAYGAAGGLGAGAAYAAYQQSQQPQQRDIPPLYSHELPRLRQEYMPSSGAGDYGATYNDNYSYGQGNPYSSQQQQQQQRRTHLDRDGRRRSKRYDSESDSEDEYRSDTRGSRPRRPAAITRRSSSYHGPNDRNDYNNSYGRNPTRSSRSQFGSTSNQQIEKYNRSRRGSDEGGSGVTGRAKNTAHKSHIQEEISDVLTTSKKGLAGGAIGAVVGGWVANKAQTAYGTGERKRSGGVYEPNPLLTLIGAAVGGLAIDAAVAR